jgi:hypothetical protein
VKDEIGREMAGQFCLHFLLPRKSQGCFYMPQICDMGQTALLSLRRKACCEFFRPKNPTALAGSEPAILGTRGQHANQQTTEAVKKMIQYNILVCRYDKILVIVAACVISGKILTSAPLPPTPTPNQELHMQPHLPTYYHILSQLPTFCHIYQHFIKFTNILSHLPTFYQIYQHFIKFTNILSHLTTFYKIYQHFVTFTNILSNLPTFCHIYQHFIKFTNILSHLPTFYHIYQHFITFTNILSNLPTFYHIYQHFTTTTHQYTIFYHFNNP